MARFRDTDIDSVEWRKRRRECFERDDHRCQFCEFQPSNLADVEKLHAHHIVPRREGGENQLSNLITVCDSCHRTVEETTRKAISGAASIQFSSNIFEKLDKLIIECLGNDLGQAQETESNSTIGLRGHDVPLREATTYKDYPLLDLDLKPVDDETYFYYRYGRYEMAIYMLKMIFEEVDKEMPRQDDLIQF